MVTTLLQRSSSREIGYEMAQYIATRFTVTGTNPSQKLGTLPAGSVIMGIMSRVITAVAGGTPVLAVGAVPTGTAAPTFALSAPNTLNVTMAEAAGSELVFPTTDIAQPLATDYDVYVGTSGGVTSGDAVVAVLFIKPLA